MLRIKVEVKKEETKENWLIESMTALGIVFKCIINQSSSVRTRYEKFIPSSFLISSHLLDAHS